MAYKNTQFTIIWFCRSIPGRLTNDYLGAIDNLVSFFHCLGFNGGNLVERFLSMGLAKGPQVIAIGQQFTESRHKAEFSHCQE